MKEERQLDIKGILERFSLIESSLHRAKLPFETDLVHEETKEVTMWELMKSIQNMEELIKEIGYPRFEPVVSRSIYYPPLSIKALHLCDICGSPHCQSDHK